MSEHLEVWFAGATSLMALAEHRLTIGRREDNDVHLDDPETSGVHAVIQPVGGGWSVRDLNSSNGTFVNGARLIGERPLRSGDEIRVGRGRLVFRSSADRQLAPTVVVDQHVPDITRRERDVLIALFGGRVPGEVFFEPASTREIAGTLNVSLAAVKQHLLHLYDKFGLRGEGERNRARLANDAMRMGIVTIADLIEAAQR